MICRVYTKTNQVTSGIFHGIPLESNFITSMYIVTGVGSLTVCNTVTYLYHRCSIKK